MENQPYNIRLVLIATASESQSQQIATRLAPQTTACRYACPPGGIEAALRITEVMPDLLIVQADLAQDTRAAKMVDKFVKTYPLYPLHILLISPLPEKGFCVEEILSGRIQFVSSAEAETLLPAVQKAFSGSGSEEEFFPQIRRLAPGELLCRAGEQNETVYLVKSGRLRAFLNLEKGGMDFLGEILPGELVGENAHLAGGGRSASVHALVHSELFEIPPQKLDSLIFTKPAWSRALIQTLSKRIRRSNQKRSSDG